VRAEMNIRASYEHTLSAARQVVSTANLAKLSTGNKNGLKCQERNIILDGRKVPSTDGKRVMYRSARTHWLADCTRHMFRRQLVA
jgi:hypothetical protein